MLCFALLYFGFLFAFPFLTAISIINDGDESTRKPKGTTQFLKSWEIDPRGASDDREMRVLSTENCGTPVLTDTRSVLLAEILYRLRNLCY